MRFPYYTLSIFLVIIILGIISFYYFHPEKDKYSEVCFEENCYSIEIAETPLQKERGLMHRQSLPLKSGMLFPYDKNGIYSFWMKNTLIPLDIIWLNENDEVVYISANTPPCTEDPCPVYGPNFESRSILELNGGQVEQAGIAIGSKAVLK